MPQVAGWPFVEHRIVWCTYLVDCRAASGVEDGLQPGERRWEAELEVLKEMRVVVHSLLWSSIQDVPTISCFKKVCVDDLVCLAGFCARFGYAEPTVAVRAAVRCVFRGSLVQGAMVAAGLSCLQIADETGGLFQLLEGSGTYDALVPIAVVTAERELDRQLLAARCADLVRFPSICARNPPTSARAQYMRIDQKLAR